MRPVQLEINKYGLINCLDEHCIFRMSCSNHDSAGDFRYEDGCSPKVIVNHQEQKYWCITTDEKVDPDDRFATVPLNGDRSGAVMFDFTTGKITHCINEDLD